MTIVHMWISCGSGQQHYHYPFRPRLYLPPQGIVIDRPIGTYFISIAFARCHRCALYSAIRWYCLPRVLVIIDRVIGVDHSVDSNSQCRIICSRGKYSRHFNFVMFSDKMSRYVTEGIEIRLLVLQLSTLRQFGPLDLQMTWRASSTSTDYAL